MGAFSGLDYIILIIIGLSVITGLFRGFIKELFALGIWIAALWGAGHYSTQFSGILKPWVNQSELRLFASFIVIVLLVLLAGGLLNSLLSFLVNRSGLSGTDRLLGMVFGFIRAVFIISLLMVVAKISGFPEEKYKSQSKLYAEFTPVVKWMYSLVPNLLDKIKSIDPSDDSKKTAANFNETYHIANQLKDFRVQQ
jgi:membrane protein required for colicin V production